MINEVSKLKQDLHGDIFVPASHQLVRTLMEHDRRPMARESSDGR